MSGDGGDDLRLSPHHRGADRNWGKHRHLVYRFGKPVGSNGFVDDREAYVGHPQWRDQPLGGGLYWRLVLGRDFPSSEQEMREAAARKVSAAEAA